MQKRGQISVEYLIVVGFVTFLVISVLAIAVYYSTGIQDRIKVSQMEGYATKLVSNAESVFFLGEPSRITINVYLPRGVQSVSIISQSLVITMETDSGAITRVFESDVPISAPGGLTNNEGLKKLQLQATSTEVVVTAVA